LLQHQEQVETAAAKVFSGGLGNWMVIIVFKFMVCITKRRTQQTETLTAIGSRFFTHKLPNHSSEL
jgi:hypothetical protein